MTLQVQLVEAHSSVQQALDEIAQSVVDSGGRRLGLRAGTASLAFNNTVGQNLAIPHGLGRAPIAAYVGPVDGTEFLTVQQSAAPDATNLYVSANVAATRTVHWIAIG